VWLLPIFDIPSQRPDLFEGFTYFVSGDTFVDGRAANTSQMIELD
jgi:hypothetical protein